MTLYLIDNSIIDDEEKMDTIKQVNDIVVYLAFNDLEPN